MNDAERSILALAEVQHGAISRQQALAARMSARVIGRRLADGEWEPVYAAAYRLAGSEPTWEQRIMAGVLAAGPGAVASYRAAAAVQGIPGVPRWPEVTVQRPRMVRVEGLRGHQTRLLPPEDVTKKEGIPVTVAGRTIADLSLIYGKAKLDPILNYAMAQQLVSRAEMVARASQRSHDDVLWQMLDERPDTARPLGSEFEARLFAALRSAGLPLPVTQYRIMIDGLDKYVDFAYPEVKLVLSADSYLWHSDPESWRKDRARDGELVALGWSVLPITTDLVWYQPALMASRVRRALEARRAG